VRSVQRLAFALVCAVSSVAIPVAQGRDIEAGPIMGNWDAQNKCPRVCEQNGGAKWSGQWHTITGTMTSVCDCQGGSSQNRSRSQAEWLDAGPLFSQFDAQNKCPGVCQRGGGSWDGNWKTTGPGVSVCACAGMNSWAGGGSGTSCRARGRGQCAGCSAQCGNGQRATCQEGTTADDRMRNGDQSCVAMAQCTCR
jgi:hypothetical protein